MNNEIKEILDRLNKIVPYADVPKELAYMTTNITPQECKLLLDYITNLQEQLHQASLDIQELTERDIECPSWCDKLTNLQEENNKLKNLEYKFFDCSGDEESFTLNDYLELSNKVYDLQEENERLKDLCDKYEEEHSNEFQCWKRDRKELLDKRARIEKAVEILGRYKHLLSPTEEQAIEQEEIVENAYDVLNGRSDE